MVEQHETLLRGSSQLGGGLAPVILQRTDEDPIGVLLEKLASDDGRHELAASKAAQTTKQGLLELFQPVHRAWHLAVLEVSCQAPGMPRLDPRRIASAGLVVRRLGAKGVLEGWRRAGRKVRGWLPFDPGEERLDPEPKKRRPERSSGHPQIDRRLLLVGLREPLEESVSPLFVAPPEVCKAAGKTLLYGLVPLASGERSEAPAAPEVVEEDFAEGAREQIPVLLKSQNAHGYPWTGTGRDLTRETPEAGLASLLATLQHLHVQLDAFDGSGPGRRVLDLLDELRLPFGGVYRPAGRFLAAAAEVLLFRSPEAKAVQAPDFWPAIPDGLRRRIEEAIVAAMKARLATLTAGEGRYAAPAGRYVLEAFVRVRGHHPGCPERLVWTEERTPSFRIIPWHEAGALPPTQVALPDVFDRAVLRKLRPNVAFVLPKGLKQKIDAASLSDLIDGKGGSSNGWDLGWICGFNIPLITLCAFFVLNIFLQLLNIVFFWLAFIKICIPFPRK
jgi:hypothetical protein